MGGMARIQFGNNVNLIGGGEMRAPAGCLTDCRRTRVGRVLHCSLVECTRVHSIGERPTDGLQRIIHEPHPRSVRSLNVLHNMAAFGDTCPARSIPLATHQLAYSCLDEVETHRIDSSSLNEQSRFVIPASGCFKTISCM